jgi:uncharacterized membrane protein YdjX (TVP38/TMEM64 family)
VVLARQAELLRTSTGLGGAIGKAALLLAGLVAAGLALRLLGTEVLSAKPTFLGGFELVVAGGALTACGVPRQAVAFAAGYAFGAWRGGILAMAAQMLGACADFWWARAVAREWAVRRLRGRFARLDLTLATRPFSATLTLRLLPVGNNLLLNLLAGVSGLRAWPFLAASFLGYLPQTAVFALAGSGVHVDRMVQLGLAGALFAVSAALGVALLRR